jgi:hypothetical protein
MAQMGFGIGGNIKKVAKDSGKRLIISGTNRAIRAIDGSGFRLSSGQARETSDLSKKYGKYAPSMDTSSGAEIDSNGNMVNTGGNIKAVGKDSGKRLIISGTNRAIRAIDGSGIGDVKKSFLSGSEKAVNAMTGSSVNRLKKGKLWEQFANATIRDGIDTAGKAARVYYDSTDPMAQMGFGLKKRGRPRKSGGALYPAGVY